MKEYICKEEAVNLIKSFDDSSLDDYYRAGLLEAEVGIVHMSAADVVEVIHGEWIYDRTYYEADECHCSICNQLMTTAKGVRMNYCPNCGAKMIKEDLK